MKNIIFVVMGILIALVSCKKSEDFAPVQKEQIRIFMSAPAGSNSGLKSGPISERKAITAGDTIDVQDIKDVNVILFAENERGQAIDGSWYIYVIDTDRKLKGNTFVQNTSQNYPVVGSMTSIKMTFLGLYTAEFRMKNQTDLIFYIRHTGLPGSVGDDESHQYAFRLDKETYQIVADPGYPGYTLYLRCTKEESTNLGNAFAIISFESQNAFYFIEGSGVQKCKYSPGYVRVSFKTEKVPNNYGEYKVYFCFRGAGGGLWPFYYAYNSAWLQAGGDITFRTL